MKINENEMHKKVPTALVPKTAIQQTYNAAGEYA
jgi:hypothetical protein